MPARRRRAARPGRGRARAEGETLRRPLAGRRRTPTPGSTASAPGCTAGCAGTRPAPGGRGRCSSTPGRRPTSTTTSTGSPTLAEAAAEVGVERFVLDDGWFRGRRARPGRAGRLDRRPGGLARGSAPADRRDASGSAWTSASGSSPRWSTRTPTSPAPTPTGCCAAARDLPPDVAAPAGARPPGARGLRPRAGRAAARCSTSTTSRSSSGTTTATWSTSRTPAGRRCTGRRVAFYRLLDELRAAHPGLEIEIVRQRWRPDRPRGADPHRPGLAERHHRRRRAAADPALDLAARAARDARRPPRRTGRPHHRPHAPARASAPPPRCSATSASSGTCAGSTPTTARRGRGLGRAAQADPAGAVARAGWCAATTPTRRCWSPASSPTDAGEAWYVVATVDTLVTQSPTAGAAARPRPGPDLPGHPEDPPGDRHVGRPRASLARRRRASRCPGSVLGSAGRPAAGAGARESRVRPARVGRRLTGVFDLADDWVWDFWVTPDDGERLPPVLPARAALPRRPRPAPRQRAGRARRLHDLVHVDPRSPTRSRRSPAPASTTSPAGPGCVVRGRRRTGGCSPPASPAPTAGGAADRVGYVRRPR